MNANQKQIADTVVKIFSSLDLKENNIRKVGTAFNVLDAPDSEWTEIEDSVLRIIANLKEVK